MKIQVLVFFVSCLFVVVTSNHLLLGNTNDNHHMVHHAIAHYTAIPFIKRVKHVFYSGHSIINVSTIILINLFTSTSFCQRLFPRENHKRFRGNKTIQCFYLRSNLSLYHNYFRLFQLFSCDNVTNKHTESISRRKCIILT